MAVRADRLAAVATSTAGLVVLPPAVATLTALMQWPVIGPWTGFIALKSAITAAFTLTSLLLAREPLQRGNARIFTATTVALTVGWFRVATPDPGPVVVDTLDSLMWGLLAWVVLRYPYARLDGRAQRAFVVASIAWLSIGHTLLAATADDAVTRAEGWPAHAWRPTIPAAFGLHRPLAGVSAGIDAALTVWFLVLLVARIRRMSSLDRWMAAPMIAAVCAAAAPLVARVAAIASDDGMTPLAQSVAQKAMLLAVPAAFVIVLVRERLACLAVVRVVGEFRGDDGPDVEALLRRALHDPALQIRYAPEDSGAADASRALLPVAGRAGEVLGTLDVDCALTLRPALVDAAVSACAGALELGQLQLTVRRHLEELEASRRHVTESAAVARRRLEQDLHDGAQQRLLALNLHLARLQAEGAAADEIVDRVRAEIKAATAELRDLTRGVSVAALVRDGLPAAVADVAARLPLDVELDIATAACSRRSEDTVYFVVCESLANTVKHAGATRASVRVTSRDGALVVEVADNGCGGADDNRGTGLRGLGRRVDEAGGQWHVHSPRGGGTRITATVPAGLPAGRPPLTVVGR